MPVLRSMLSASLLLFCLQLAHAGEHQHDLLPIDYFTRSDYVEAVKISPDGKYLATVTGTSLLIAETQSQTATAVARSNYGAAVREFHWASPNRLIYISSWDEIFAVDATGEHHISLARRNRRVPGVKLIGYESRGPLTHIISTLPDDDSHVLAAEYPRATLDAKPNVVKLNVHSGKRTIVDSAPLSNPQFVLDQDDNARFVIGVDPQGRFAVSWKERPESAWTDFELAHVFRLETVVPHRFDGRNNALLLTAARLGERYAALHRYHIDSQQVERLGRFENADVMDVVTDLGGTHVIGYRGYSDKPILGWIDPSHPHAQLYLALQASFVNQSVGVTSATADGRLAIVYAYSDVNPGEYFLFDVAGRKADVLQRERRWVDPALMRPKQAIQLIARDGVALHGYVTRPKREGPHPLVVLAHDGLYGVRDRWEFDPTVQLLANRGYAVLQVNFRGSAGYGIDFMQLGNRQAGAVMQDDITDATHWAIANKIATADRICIFGVGYGAHAALMGVAREPDLYRCAVGLAGVYDLEHMRKSDPLRHSNVGRAILDAVLGTDGADLKRRSPVNLAKNIKASVLLIHSLADEYAGYRQAAKMRAALERHDKDVEWVVLPGARHDIDDGPTRKDVYERVVEFLNEQLPTGNSDQVPLKTAQTPQINKLVNRIHRAP